MLKGFVNINVTEDSLMCSTVSVDFTGFAKTCVAYKQRVRKGGGRARPGDSAQETKVVKKKKRETQTFFRQKADIAKFDPKKPVDLGVYQFPFAFQVPLDAQSTCVIQGHGSGNTAIVQYQIGVLLVRPGFMKSDLVQKIPVDIISSLRQDIAPAYVSDTKPVTCCCCIPRGTARRYAADCCRLERRCIVHTARRTLGNSFFASALRFN